MAESEYYITPNQTIIIYVIIIIISLLFLFGSIIVLIVYFKRDQWNLQMTMTTLLTFFALLHTIDTSIPINDGELLCDISSSLHESSLMGIAFYPDFFFLYAYLSFEKPYWITHYRWFFVYFINGLVIAIFIIGFIVFALLGDNLFNYKLYQCRINNESIRYFLAVYCGIAGFFAFILLLVLIIRFFFIYHKESNDNLQIKEFINKMVLYGVSLFSIIINFIVYEIKEHNKIFGWLLTAKILECSLGLCFLIVFGYNSRFSGELKNLCSKNNNKLHSELMNESLMKEYTKEIDLVETI